MFRLLRLTLSLALLSCFSGLFSQAQEPLPAATVSNQETLTEDAALNIHRWGAITLFHGLPSDRVRAIAEDGQGALWIATEAGLVRYDGRNVQPFAQENALPSRRILALAFDNQGSLWIGTAAGAARVRNEQVQVLAETRNRTVTGIACNARGETVVITAQGEIIRYHSNDTAQAQAQNAQPPRLLVDQLDPSNQRLLRLDDQQNTAQPVSLNCITTTANQDFRIGASGRGVLIYQPTNPNPAERLREIAVRPPRPYFINALLATDDQLTGNNLWIGEQSGRTPGLWLVEQDAQPQRLPLASGTVTALSGDAREQWIGTWANGAYLMRGGVVIEHLTFESTAGGLRSNRVTAIWRDRDGVIWFGTERGVSRFDRDSFRAVTLSQSGQSNFVRSLMQSANGETLCGTNRGLFTLPAGSDLGPWRAAAEFATRSVYALHESRDGTLWAGTNAGVLVRPLGTTSFTRLGNTDEDARAQTTLGDELTINPNDRESAIESAATSTASTSDVRAFAAFRNQLYVANFARGVEVVGEKGELTPVRALSATQPLCLLNENDAALWVGTAAGKLWRFDGQTAIAIELPATKGEFAIRALALADGRVWLGSSQGLFVRNGNAWQALNLDANVFALTAQRNDTDEILWCATQNAGLLKLLPKSGLTIRFDTQQGLASQQVFALAARLHQTKATGNTSVNQPDGLWIGTARGLVRHQPSHAQPRIEARRLVANETYRPEYLTAELSLPSTQRNFLLEVTALGSRTYPSQFQYEFTIQRRSGEESRTILTTDPQFAVDNLRAGPYTVSARAISRDLVYSEPLIVKLRVRNAPFPWSTVFLTALLIAASLAAYWFFRQRKRLASTNASLELTNAELRDTRLRLARETETERARIARDLHDQTLADLRNLLVLTDQLPQREADTGALEKEKDAPSPAVLRRKIETISAEIRHICEDLSPSVLENIGFLPALEWALSDAVAQLPGDQKFAYEFQCAPDLEDRLTLSAIEKIQLYRIVQEALNNICRHARARNVHVRVQLRAATTLSLNKHVDQPRALAIEIADDGLGFDGTTESITGHGIANIRSRANLIGATVEWQRLAPGCLFIVKMDEAVQAAENGSGDKQLRANLVL